MGAATPARATLSAALSELVLIAILYLVYTGSRLLASQDRTAALRSAARIQDWERLLGLHWERMVNGWFVDNADLGEVASYWYATTHYVVTVAVLVWLFVRHRSSYAPARAALVAATMTALVFYLVIPTAPPRFVEGFTDVLFVHSDAGWWGADASAPKGLGGLTNELAAFPSMHAGWALWVAFAVASLTCSLWARGAAVAYAVITGVVIVGTGNHWVVDVLAGWAVVAAAWWAVVISPRGGVTPCVPLREPTDSRATTTANHQEDA